MKDVASDIILGDDATLAALELSIEGHFFVPSEWARTVTGGLAVSLIAAWLSLHFGPAWLSGVVLVVFALLLLVVFGLTDRRRVTFLPNGVGVKRAGAVELVAAYAQIQSVTQDGASIVVDRGTRKVRLERLGSREPGTSEDLVRDLRRLLVSRAIHARGLGDDVVAVTEFLQRAEPASQYRQSAPRAALESVASAAIVPQALRDAAARALQS